MELKVEESRHRLPSHARIGHRVVRKADHVELAASGFELVKEPGVVLVGFVDVDDHLGGRKNQMCIRDRSIVVQCSNFRLNNREFIGMMPNRNRYKSVSYTHLIFLRGLSPS